jgi:serine/threonine protein kinase
MLGIEVLKKFRDDTFSTKIPLTDNCLYENAKFVFIKTEERVKPISKERFKLDVEENVEFAKLMVHQSLDCLIKIHKKHLTLNDIKPKSLFVTATDPPLLKIWGFGKLRQMAEGVEVRDITIGLVSNIDEFTAPELNKDSLLQKFNLYKSDLYSFAATFWFLIHEESFENKKIVDFFQYVFKYDRALAVTLVYMLDPKPEGRPNCYQISQIWEHLVNN